MFDEIKKYKNYGHFFFKRGGNLKQVSKSVPDLPGVYYIVRLFKGKIELVYIDKSGTCRPQTNGRIERFWRILYDECILCQNKTLTKEELQAELGR